LLEAALRPYGLPLVAPQVPFRPAESPRLTAAPRAVFQAVLPDEPTGGYITVYEFPSTTESADAGREMAHFLQSGPGQVNYPPDARFVLRQVGTTLVFFAWAPSTASDPRIEDVARALETVGQGIPVRR
ncbi:MAG TPA: hypothetical protein VNJ28_07920, partial [Candidatus Limnocylindrales bacterium]|nr:hypothetical protein [Candidatus Limnocylindrales bacterium]